MLRSKSGLVCVLVMFAVLVAGGVAASSASAVEFKLEETLCSGGNTIIFCYENETTKALLELVGEEEFEILSPDPSSLTAKLGEETLTIECANASAGHGASTALFESLGLILQWTPLGSGSLSYLVDLTLAFTKCAVTSPKEKCAIQEPLITAPLDGTPETDEVIQFTPETGTTFAILNLENKGTATCPATIVGARKVVGTQLCTFAEALVDLTEHLIECGASELLFIENAVTFTLDASLLPDNLNERWDIVPEG
jgi:hypothetical protein